MKAAILEAPATELIVEEIDCQGPRTGEVLVRIAASGVCHSDLNVVHGTQTSPLPVVLGHEGAGIVEEVGPNVTRVKVGDHVVLSWVPYCGQCVYCLSGHVKRPNNYEHPMSITMRELVYALGGGMMVTIELPH